MASLLRSAKQCSLACAALALAACVGGPDSGPFVEVAAVAEGADARVRFRRTRIGSGRHRARLIATGGTLAEVVHSADRGTVSALWRDRSGRLECRFAYGGQGEFDARDALAPGLVEYVFLETDACSITAVVPRANPMRPALPLKIRVDPSRLPATFSAADRPPVRLGEERSTLDFELPTRGAGVLAEGEIEVEILTSDGSVHSTLIGVDADGTPVAAIGFVREAGS